MIAGNRYHIEQNDLDTWNNNGLDTRNSNDLDTRNSNDLDKRNSNDLDTRNIKTVDYVISAENRNIDAGRVQVHNNNYMPSFNDNYNNWKILKSLHITITALCFANNCVIYRQTIFKIFISFMH